ncbi:MAG: thermonuclease family protein [Alphaproteobacteria bacterium]|nr:thermonuclease family protein [Alphaproteobacteria bacterium]
MKKHRSRDAAARRSPQPVAVCAWTCKQILGAAFAIASAGAEEVVAGPVPGVVERVVDGDTIAVTAHIWLGQEVRTLVRLAGIDTPESRGPKCRREARLAAEAAKALEEVLAGRSVSLEEIRHDKFGGRVVARVYAPDGTDIAEILRARGLAVAYDGRAKSSWCVAPAAPPVSRPD